MRVLPVLLTGILLLGALPAQAETVYGRVYDTLKGKIFANTRVVLVANPEKEATTDSSGSFWIRDVRPGPYLVHIYTADREVVGRLLVYKTPTTIANLDLAKIEAPGAEDEY